MIVNIKQRNTSDYLISDSHRGKKNSKAENKGEKRKEGTYWTKLVYHIIKQNSKIFWENTQVYCYVQSSINIFPERSWF